MAQKVYATPSYTAVFECPQCKNSRSVDVSKFKKIEKEVKIKVNCPCGHSYRVVLERRRHYRKTVNLAGSYLFLIPGDQAKKKMLTVTDVSRSGLKIKVSEKPDFAVGDKIFVEFHLDDNKRSLIKKETIVRTIRQLQIGLEFSSTDSADSGDKALGFYLFS
jgi:hypothetical protein